MQDEITGDWLVWGTSPPAGTRSDILSGFGSALSRALRDLPVVRLDDSPPGTPSGEAAPATSDDEAHDAEADVTEDAGDTAALIALIHTRDPRWTPPGEPHPAGLTSWMEVLRDVTEGEATNIASGRTGTTRGVLRLE